jgi:peptide/nickel transport system ATP-binding protein
MSEALLSVRDLCVEFSTYGRTNKVLHNVSLDVPAHSQVALVGESGSGKTVTMKAIMGLLREPPARITGGRILYDGADLLTMPAAERLKLRGTAMSMVFQDPMSSLNPVFTIADQMGTILKYADKRLGRSRGRRERMARVHEVLAGADARSRAGFAVLSDPAFRRHAPAHPDRHGTAQRTEALIADEPGTALDVTTQAQILKLSRISSRSAGWRS